MQKKHSEPNRVITKKAEATRANAIDPFAEAVDIDPSRTTAAPDVKRGAPARQRKSATLKGPLEITEPVTSTTSEKQSTRANDTVSAPVSPVKKRSLKAEEHPVE